MTTQSITAKELQKLLESSPGASLDLLLERLNEKGIDPKNINAEQLEKELNNDPIFVAQLATAAQTLGYEENAQAYYQQTQTPTPTPAPSHRNLLMLLLALATPAGIAGLTLEQRDFVQQLAKVFPQVSPQLVVAMPKLEQTQKPQTTTTQPSKQVQPIQLALLLKQPQYIAYTDAFAGLCNQMQLQFASQACGGLNNLVTEARQIIASPSISQPALQATLEQYGKAIEAKIAQLPVSPSTLTQGLENVFKTCAEIPVPTAIVTNTQKAVAAVEQLLEQPGATASTALKLVPPGFAAKGRS